MRCRRSGAAAVWLLIGALAAASCGLGPGGESGSAELRITRDYGSQRLLEANEEGIPDSETVLRLLERNADIATRYGGGFVSSVDGIDSTTEGGRRFDWFFYVNGVESSIGSADAEVRDGDSVWWDYRDWSSAMRVPAVIGSWPEPFLHGFEGTSHRTRIDCLGAVAPCRTVRDNLDAAGVNAGILEAEHAPGFDAEAGPTLRILVGPWSAVRADPAAAQIDDGPEQSGVFARFEPGAAGFALLGLDQRAEVARRFGAGAGLVAAVRFEDQPPTWIVTAGDADGVEAAAQLLDEAALGDRYAVAAPPGEPVPLPVMAGT